MTRDELIQLVKRVFRPRPEDRALAFLVDLPDATVTDDQAWADRRRMVTLWWERLREGKDELGLEKVDLVYYRNVHSNNADLPAEAWIHQGGDHPQTAEQVSGRTTPFTEILDGYPLLIAATEFSATAPLKLAAKSHGFRGATMPGFSAEMIPALKLDYGEVSERCRRLKSLLDPAVTADLQFEAGGKVHRLVLDLRHRTATASGGLVAEPGNAGNLPSGETYIVPYEGERGGDPSRSAGTLPIQLDGELLHYRIENNRVVEVVGDGPVAASEREKMAAEPAYANVAELGLGMLSDYGVKPVGELLLDEKLGLHVAFGRSDHFGGSVGAKDFSSPDRVVHIDRVYIPEVQPAIRVVAVDLEYAEDGGTRREPLMRDGRYVEGVFG